jgi:hypothetical protein
MSWTTAGALILFFTGFLVWFVGGWFVFFH